MSGDHLEGLRTKGWAVFDYDSDLYGWVQAARLYAHDAMQDNRHAEWWRSGGTWFVGVNALPNGASGALPNNVPLEGDVISFLGKELGDIPFDSGQVSVIRPGYPVQGTESDAAYRFRQNRDAAHLDGLKRAGPANRRYMNEFHRFLLGLPLVEADSRASPLVVWEGSHIVLRNMLAEHLGHIEPQAWPDVDLTESYGKARHQIFEQCTRRIVHAAPGQAYLVHRHALHGISPWIDGATCDPLGRVIAYFRPETADRTAWLSELPLV